MRKIHKLTLYGVRRSVRKLLLRKKRWVISKADRRWILLRKTESVVASKHALVSKSPIVSKMKMMI